MSTSWSKQPTFYSGGDKEVLNTGKYWEVYTAHTPVWKMSWKHSINTFQWNIYMRNDGGMDEGIGDKAQTHANHTS